MSSSMLSVCALPRDSAVATSMTLFPLMFISVSVPQWWNVETGEALQTFYPTGSALKKIHVSSDFTTFVTIDSVGILYILRRVAWCRTAFVSLKTCGLWHTGQQSLYSMTCTVSAPKMWSPMISDLHCHPIYITTHHFLITGLVLFFSYICNSSILPEKSGAFSVQAAK